MDTHVKQIYKDYKDQQKIQKYLNIIKEKDKKIKELEITIDILKNIINEKRGETSV